MSNTSPVIIVADATQVINIIEVTNAELLAIDFDEDDEAEFVQGLLKIQDTLEQVILSDNPEEFLMPTQTEEAPIWKMIELVDELKLMRFGDRTLSRMERFARGEERQIEKLTELEKAERDDYKKCPSCPYHYKGKRGLENHMKRQICKRVAVGQILHPVEKQKKVSDKLYHLVMKLDDMVARSNDYKKKIAADKELVEEDIEDPELCGRCQVEPSEWEGKGGYYCKPCFDAIPDDCVDCLQPRDTEDENITEELTEAGYNEDMETLCLICWGDRINKWVDEAEIEGEYMDAEAIISSYH